MNKKKLGLWSFYNFGGAIVQIVFILYFSQWLVIDRGLPDFWFNATLIASSALILLAAPIASAWGDRGGRRLFGLRIGTVAAAICFALVGVVAALFPTHTTLAAVLFTLGLFFYLFGAIFWYAFLTDVAPPERFGIASGWAQVADWLGEISGLLIVLPLVSGAIVLFGAGGHAQAFLPAAVLFLLCAMPMMLWYKESKPKQAVRHSLVAEYKGSISEFFALAKTNKLGWFFLAFFFFNDAVITAANNFSIYLQRVFHATDTVKSLFLLVILCSAAVGSLIGGWLVDTIGYRRALLYNLGGWIVILPVMAVTTNFAFFTAEAIVMGLWFGSIWVIARSVIAHLTPAGSLNRAFSYYTLMERFATLIGPVSWSIIIALAPKQGGLNYHIGFMSMTIFVIAGFFLARKIPASAPSPSLVS